MNYDFAYIVVVIMAIAGMLIIVNGFRRMFLLRHFSILLVIPTIMLFIEHIEVLYSSWVQKSNAPLDMGGTILFVLIPSLWTVISAVLFPLTDEDFSDLENHYFRTKNFIFGVAALNVVLAIISDTYYGGYSLADIRILWQMVIVCEFVFLAVEWFPINRKKALHIFFWVVMIAPVFIRFLDLSKKP